MIGKAVWDWICSAPKRPYIQRSYDELVAIVSSADAADTKILKSIQEELDYRKRLKASKREELIELIYRKARVSQAAPESSEDCRREALTVEDEEYRQGTDKPKELGKDSSKGNQANMREGRKKGNASEEDGEYNSNGHTTEEIEKGERLGTTRTTASQLSITEEKAIETNGKDNLRITYQLDLSRKTYNALRRNGFQDFTMLQYMDDEDILTLRGIGQKSLAEIREAFPLAEEVDERASEIACKPVIPNDGVDAIHHDDKDEGSEDKVGESGKEGNEQRAIQEREEIDLGDLVMIETFSTYRKEVECLNEAIDSDRKCLCMASAINDERSFVFLLKRMNGMTLEAIGEEAGVTRERVRQVIKKTSQKLGIEIGELCRLLEQRSQKANELRISRALDSDLQDHQMISNTTRHEWKRINGRDMSLRDRIEMLRRFHVPIPANELRDHLGIIEEGKGQYGGTEYWDDNAILGLLLNIIALNNDKPGVMPRQIEIPRLLSRYIQKKGGQRQVACILGMPYEGPIGSRNRNYWTELRISQAIRDTQQYFGLPEDTMPEQTQISIWLELDGNNDTKGPSCIAAIKREGGWTHFCKKEGYKRYIDQDDDGKKEIDSKILLSLWNRNAFVTNESEFMDVFTEFLGEFWNSQSDPRRYASLVSNARKVAKCLADYSGEISTEQRKDIIIRAVNTSTTLDGLTTEKEGSGSVDVDRFVDLLF